MNGLVEQRDRWLVALGLAGVGIATYLSYVKLFGLKAYCAGVGNCEAVQSSPYAELFGIPIAILGLGAYLALLALLWVKVSNWKELRYPAVQGFFFVSLVGVLFSAYLTYLELYVIRAICPWCVASAIVITVMFALSLGEMLQDLRDYDEDLAAEHAGSQPGLRER